MTRQHTHASPQPSHMPTLRPAPLWLFSRRWPCSCLRSVTISCVGQSSLIRTIADPFSRVGPWLAWSTLARDGTRQPPEKCFGPASPCCCWACPLSRLRGRTAPVRGCATRAVARRRYSVGDRQNARCRRRGPGRAAWGRRRAHGYPPPPTGPSAVEQFFSRIKQHPAGVVHLSSASEGPPPSGRPKRVDGHRLGPCRVSRVMWSMRARAPSISSSETSTASGTSSWGCP